MFLRHAQLRQELLLAICCAALWFAELQRPLAADVAWLLDAGSRWFHGQVLYVDIIELNPPLIFYDMAVLTGGAWTKASYIAGVCIAIFVSSILCDRRWIAFVALSAPALAPFGQRDHLALIAVLPYVVARRSSWPLGIWMFAGVALKPQLLLIPILAALWRRSVDPAIVICGCLVGSYGVFIAIVHPTYLTEIVPLARATYGSLGGHFAFIHQFILIVLVAAMNWRSPVSGAIVGALLSYFLQGKFWYYQLVPAVGLAIYQGAASQIFHNVNRACAAALVILSAASAARMARPVDPIPEGAKRVLFLTAHIPVAYPVVFERGVENTSPYPSLWPVPGAATRQDILAEVRRRQVDEVLKRCPQYIFTNRKEAFDYMQFLSTDRRFHGYRFIGEKGSFRIYASRRCLQIRD